MTQVIYKKPKVILFFKERKNDPIEGEKIINQKRLYPNEEQVKLFIEKLIQKRTNGLRDVWDISYKIIHKVKEGENDSI